jgi:hypothetical protein
MASTRSRVVDAYRSISYLEAKRPLWGEKERSVRTSNPATFSTSRRTGAAPRSERAGNTFSIKCRKDCARGSAAPFAFGLSTVYGWHAGDMSHRFALSDSSASASSVAMSTYEGELLRTRRRSASCESSEHVRCVRFQDRGLPCKRHRQVGPNQTRGQRSRCSRRCPLKERSAVHLFHNVGNMKADGHPALLTYAAIKLERPD